jgi:hypothetical protein
MGDTAAVGEARARCLGVRRSEQSLQPHIPNTLERICKKVEEKVK